MRRHSIGFGLAAVVLVASVMALAACGDDGETPAENGGGETPAGNGGDMTQGPPGVSGETVTTDSGLQYIVIEEGTGASPKLGQTVVVHYTGWLESDGTKFDSSVDRGAPSSFMLGQVIEGWNEGLSTMKVGGKHRLIIPPELGYGAAGRPGIPPNATLIFDVELLQIQ
jgi:peptidylprolyl isomerase